MYQGYWSKENNERQGIGAIVWDDGSMYEGYWVDGQPEGPGRMVIHYFRVSIIHL
jgi:hypothetical protein